MEDLQLALTAARVEQRNFGLWLRSWQVGQVLQALVTDRAPSGELVLRIGGQQVTATADIPVQKGAVLALEVSSLTPVPILKVISRVARGQAADNPLPPQLQTLVARQGAVAAPFASLAQTTGASSLLAMLGLRGDILDPIIRSVSGFSELSDPVQLRRRVRQSGLFLESGLSRAESGTTRPFLLDLKATLLRLWRRTEQVLQTGVQATVEETEQIQGRNQLIAFRQQLEGALSTISLNQFLSATTREDGGGNMWLIHLPFHTPEGVFNLSLRISQEKGSSGSTGRDAEFKILLDLTLPKLGNIEAELFLRKQRVSVVIYSREEKTAKAIEQELATLRDGLESRGLEVSVLRSHRGSRTPDLVADGVSPQLDEKA